MPYTQTNWIDGTTPLNRTNMMKIEDELALLDSGGATAKGQANGYASLGTDGKVPTVQLPSTAVPSYGTTLPASPVDGQEAILVDSITNPSYQWRFRFNAGSAAAKWEYVGGTPKHAAYGSTIQNTASGSWQLVANAPGFAFPRAGQYRYRFGAKVYHTIAGDIQYVGVGVSAPGVYAIQIQVQAPTSNPNMTTAAIEANDVQLNYSRTTAETISIWLHATNYVNCNVQSPWLSIEPIRVS